jgi:preflagellin peptidase FlaK
MVDTIIIREVITLPLLIYASFLDIKYREINSLVWRVMFAIGILILLIDLNQTGFRSLLISFLIVVAAAAIFSVSLHSLGAMGGGDAKLLIALGALFPILPGGNFLLPLFFLSVFSNAVLISLIVPLVLFLYNIKREWKVRSPKELFRLFVAYQKEGSKIGKFEAALEKDKVLINTKNIELGKSGAKGVVWVTPALPFAVFITLGYVVSIYYGDLLTLFM